METKILSQFISLARKLKRLPNYSDCLLIGIRRHNIRHYFGNITTLQKIANLKLKFSTAPKNMEELFKQVAGVK